MSQSEKASRFRQLHERDGAFLIPNPFDLGSLRVLEGLGYEALATTSAGFAFTRGKIDGETSAGEVLEHCRDLCDASTLPISADLGIGFGESPESAAQTIHEAAATGLVGCSIEDTPPLGAGGQFPLDLAVERIDAAVEAARTLPHDFLVTARCEHLAYGGTDIDGVIKRLQAFEAAGADVLYAPGLVDPDTIRLMCSSLTKPINVLIGFRAITLGLEDLQALGVKRVSVGVMFARTAYSAVIKAAKELKETGRAHDSSDEVRSKEMAGYFL